LSVVSPPAVIPAPIDATPKDRVARVRLDRDGLTRRVTRQRMVDLIRRPSVDARILTALLAVATVAHGWGMTGSPGALDDEGTYIAQAWAVQNWGTLAHYTYWYDHPPLGWMQIALWSTVTRAFSAASYAVLAGRQLMLVVQLVSCVLLYALGRRIGLRRPAATAAVLLFALSPLAVVFHRYVLLDNIATPWLIGAFVLAASPRRHLGAAAGAAVCMAIAALTKETTLVLLPALAWQLWVNGDRRTRHFTVALFVGVFVSVLAAYPLLALLKDELVPGAGHVSLIGSVIWQLSGRSTSGSLLDPDSGARGLFNLWSGIDPWLLWAGIVLTPFAFRWRTLRPVALGLGIQVLMMLRNGYLPYPYVIAMLPFAAVVVAAVTDHVWGWVSAPAPAPAPASGSVSVSVSVLPPVHACTDADALLLWGRADALTETDAMLLSHRTLALADAAPAVDTDGLPQQLRLRRLRRLWARSGGTHRLEGTDPLPLWDPAPLTGWSAGAAVSRWSTIGQAQPVAVGRRAAVAIAVVVFLLVGVPAWTRGLHDQMTTDRTVALRQADNWLAANARRDDVVVVDDSLWVDLVDRGLPPDKVIWFYKVDLDPAVKLPNGWRSIAYVVLGQLSPTTAGLPTVSQAIDHSQVVATFGDGPDSLTIRRVES
jgi:hypothetical protein